MALWDTLKKHAGAQFLEVIDWVDDSKNTLVYRYPTFNQAITDNSKLVVREGQAGVFVAEGKLSDVFPPGTHPLDTRNAPISRFFQSIVYKLEEPYKGDVYFVSTRQFTDNGWGTSNPIMLRDAEFGPVRIRAHGVFSFRITDPASFLKQLVGTDGLFTTEEITGQLKKKLVGSLAQVVGRSRIPVLDLASSYQDLGDQLRDQLNPLLQESYGITLTDFTVQNISLPEEVEKALDARGKMGILGNLDAYSQLKAADAIEIAARNPGLGGVGASVGVGLGLGQQIGHQLGRGIGPEGGSTPPALPAGAPKLHYSGPAGQDQLSIPEIVARITADRGSNHLLWLPGWPQWKSWREVADVATQVPPAPDGGPTWHYNGPGGQAVRGLDAIMEKIRGAPREAHHVWRSGWAGWRKAEDVEEIAAALRSGAPPPVP